MPHSTTAPDDPAIVLVDEDTGERTPTTLAALLADNEDLADEADAIRSAVAQGAAYQIGGGAAAAFMVERG